MIKVRGSKGFDALFSRVFDEPGLKDAVGNMHDDFSSREAKISSRAPEHSSVAVHPPVVTPVTIDVTDVTPPAIEPPDVAPLSIELPAPVVLSDPADVIESSPDDISSPEVPLTSHSLAASSEPVHEPAVAPVIIEQPAPEHETVIDLVVIEPPTPVNVESSAVAVKIPVPQVDTVPDAKQLGQLQDSSNEPSDDSDAKVKHQEERKGNLLQEQTIYQQKSLLSTSQLQGQSIQSALTPLTEKQGKILMYLYKDAGGLTNVDIIGRDLGIEYPTVRESLLVLVTEGYLYLLDKKRIDGHASSGFTYTMNNHLCSLYAATVRDGAVPSQGQTSGSSGGLSAGRSLVFSKSLLIEKEAIVAQDVLSGAVGAYWEEEGLVELQAQKWCSIFGVEPAQMSQQLEWARFDLETNKRRETVKKDVISWFYDRLMITGGLYPRPANYKSATELRAEDMQQQRDHDLSARAKFAEIEFVNSLQSFLAYPDAPLYQELLGRVNHFLMEQLNACEGRGGEIGLAASFKVNWSMTNNDPAATSVSFALSDVGTAQLMPVGGICRTSDKRVLVKDDISGKEVDLAAGWNLVGYNAVASQPVNQAISSISSFVESIWGWSKGKWHSYAPSRPANSLTILEPGMGYWIKMKQPAIWTLL